MNILDQIGALIADLRQNVSDLAHEVEILKRELRKIVALPTDQTASSAQCAAVAIAMDALEEAQARAIKRSTDNFTR